MDHSAHSRFYFKQLLAGRDFAAHDPRARMMENFVYIIGDRQTRVGVQFVRKLYKLACSSTSNSQ